MAKLCSICEKSFDPSDVHHYELGAHLPPNHRRSFDACDSCAVLEKLNWYKVNYELARESNEKMKQECNLFRTLMMKVETMAAIGEESTISARSYILQHRAGWEALPLDTLIFFLDLYQKHASVFAELINKKASKEEISSHLRKKTDDQKATEKRVLDKARIKENGGLKGEYTADEKKALISLMKSPVGKGKTEEQVYEMMTGMIKGALKARDSEVTP